MNTKTLIAGALALGAWLGGVSAAAVTTHTVVTGEHLWRLAGDYYKDHYKWRKIHGANTDKVKDPHWIYPGQILVIPDMGGEGVDAGLDVEEPAAPAPAQAAAPAEDSDDAPPPPPATPSLGEGGPSTEDLSRDMPPSVTGHFTNMGRIKAPKGWKEDGAITVFEGREIMAAEGDVVNAKLNGHLAPKAGERFTVYRGAASLESDADPKATYLQRVGVVEVKEKLSGSTYRLVIRRSGDSVQLGDFLKKE